MKEKRYLERKYKHGLKQQKF